MLNSVVLSFYSRLGDGPDTGTYQLPASFSCIELPNSVIFSLLFFFLNYLQAINQAQGKPDTADMCPAMQVHAGQYGQSERVASRQGGGQTIPEGSGLQVLLIGVWAADVTHWGLSCMLLINCIYIIHTAILSILSCIVGNRVHTGGAGGRGTRALFTEEHDLTSRSCYSFCPRLLMPASNSCAVLQAVGLRQNQRQCQSRGVRLCAVLGGGMCACVCA